MKYIKLFENFEESYNDILVDFKDNPNRFTVHIDSDDIISIDVKYKRMTSENENRQIIGYFDNNSVDLQSNKTGYMYDRMYKSKDTIDLVSRIEDVVLKLANFSRFKVGYFTLRGNSIRIYLGERLLAIHNSRWD